MRQPGEEEWLLPVLRRVSRIVTLPVLLAFLAYVDYDLWSLYLQDGQLPEATAFLAIIYGTLYLPTFIAMVVPILAGRGWLPSRPPRGFVGASVVLLCGFVAVLPLVLGIRDPVKGVLVILLSLVPVLPLRPFNLRYPLYLGAFIMRAFVAVGIGPIWLSYVARRTWQFGQLPVFPEGVVLFGTVLLMLYAVYYVEYRVDWAALQREVEARTGASSASA